MHIAIRCDSLQLPQSGSCSPDNGAKMHVKDTKGCTGSSLEKAAQATEKPIILCAFTAEQLHRRCAVQAEVLVHPWAEPSSVRTSEANTSRSHSSLRCHAGVCAKTRPHSPYAQTRTNRWDKSFGSISASICHSRKQHANRTTVSDANQRGSLSYRPR